MERILEQKHIELFKVYLENEEKSANTVDKYLRDVRAFFVFAGEKAVTKELVISYKKNLCEQQYAVASVNSMLASVNSFLKFMGWKDAGVKGLKTQREIYCSAEKELTKEEYKRLLTAARDRPRLKLLLQTICSTGIRVSELEYFTVEAVRKGEINVSCKNKIRRVLVPRELRKKIIRFVKENRISEGIIFRTRNGKPLNRSNIWAEMKSLCEKAKVSPGKVFPHNLRKLFARVFYKLDKDIVKLADVLGHSSINTTRIYVISTGKEHRRQMEKLGLVI